MKSFERPTAQWKEIERELKAELDETDDHRDRFGDIETRLLDAIRRLSQIALGPPFDLALSGDKIHSPPVPYAEALDVSIRHPLGHSISGHHDVRQRITEGYENMELSSELLKEMHRSMLSADTPDAGQFRANPSHFPEFDADGNWIASSLTVPPKDVPVYLDRLHERLHALMDSNAIHPFLPIAGYTFDLFRIHPFPDGNGRLTRLALLLLMHKSGYHIGKYISVEGIINMRRFAYLKAIMKTRDGWIAARHDLRPWCTFVVEVIRDAYREFSERTDELDMTTNHLSAIKQAIESMPQRFTTVELMAHLPDVPLTLARTVLNRLRRQGKLLASLNEAAVEWRKGIPTPANSEH